MTTILAENNKASLMRQKLRDKKVNDEETRSFFKVSRENLSISQSDIEQGFNKARFRPNKNTALSIVALLLATTCITIEVWKLHKVLENSREIQILKRDVETLKHRFLEEDLLDELKAFEQQLYAEDGNDETDVDEQYLDEDYDSSYDEDDWGDYQNGSVNGSLKNETNSSAGSDEDLKETLAALHAAEAKQGQEFQRNVRQNRDSIERERLLKEKRDHNKRQLHADEMHTTKKRSVQDDERFLVMPYSRNRSTVNNSDLYRQDGSKDKHSAKKNYLDHVQDPHVYLSSLLEAMNNGKRDEGEIEDDSHVNKKIDRRKLARSHEILKKRKNLQKNELSMRLQRREMTMPRHLRPPRQVCAVHYEADSSLFSSEDEHTGNGRAKHNAGVFKAWRASSWVQDFSSSNHFTLSNDGRLTVHEPGLYLVYAQIHYLDEHDENGFHVLVNGRPLFQCMVYSPGFGHKSRSCFSAQITVLKANDHVVLRDVGSARYTLFQRDKSFFGLVKLGEMRQPQRHQIQSSSSATR